MCARQNTISAKEKAPIQMAISKDFAINLSLKKKTWDTH